MNFLVLGIEYPDDSPLLLKYNLKEDPAHPLTDREKMLNATKMFQSSSSGDDMEGLRVYYKDKLHKLEEIFNRHLSSYGILNRPYGGLAVWIRLKQEQNITAILPVLADMGVYRTVDNPMLNEKMPIAGIRAGFGAPDLETYEKIFLLLANKFKTTPTKLP